MAKESLERSTADFVRLVLNREFEVSAMVEAASCGKSPAKPTCHCKRDGKRKQKSGLVEHTVVTSQFTDAAQKALGIALKAKQMIPAIDENINKLIARIRKEHPAVNESSEPGGREGQEAVESYSADQVEYLPE